MTTFYSRKYALAEPPLISGINKLEKAEEQLTFDDESLLAQIKVTDFNEEYILGYIQTELTEALYDARNYLKTVQLKLAQGIEETSVEEAYEEWLQKGRDLDFSFCFVRV